MEAGQPVAVWVEGCSGFRAGGEGWASHLGGMAGAQVGRQGRKPTTSARDGVQGVARDTCPQTHREPPGKTPRWKPCPSSTASSCAALACFRAGTGAYQPYVSVNTSIALGPERQSRSERHTGPRPPPPVSPLRPRSRRRFTGQNCSHDERAFYFLFFFFSFVTFYS